MLASLDCRNHEGSRGSGLSTQAVWVPALVVVVVWTSFVKVKPRGLVIVTVRVGVGSAQLSLLALPGGDCAPLAGSGLPSPYGWSLSSVRGDSEH